MTTSIATTQTLPTGTWQLDPTQTTITVTAKKLGFYAVPATLTVTSGTIEIGDDNQVASVEVIADAGSYTSKNAKRNEHIRSADFLDVEHHPTLTFRAGTVTPTAASHRADGSVTVKGVEHPLSVEVSDVAVDAERASFEAIATVDRTAIGVDALPTLVIGRELQLHVTATALLAAS